MFSVGKPEVKYALYPGNVRSVNDGQLHFVGAHALRHLYEVRPEECVIADFEMYPLGSKAREERRAYLDTLIALRPQYRSEDYVIPSVEKP